MLTLVPPTLITASVCPVINSVTFLLVCEVLTVVAHTIRVNVDAETLHVVLGPLAVVLAAIPPKVLPEAIDFIVKPLPVIS